MLSLNGTHGTRGGTHNQRLGGHNVLAVANAAQQLTVGDTGCGKEAVVAGDQVVGGQHAVEVVAGFQRLFTLCLVGRCQAALDNATGCLDSARCDNAFGGAAGAEHEVHAGVFAAGCDSAGDVTVEDDAGTGTCLANLLNQLGVAGAVQHAYGQLADLLALSLSDQVQVLLDGQAQVDELCGFGAGDQLLHVEHCGGVEHGAAVCHSNHGEGVVHAECGQAGTVDGVNRDVEGGTGAVADVLAVVQHGSLVLLAFTDDDGAVEVDGGEAVTHCVYGCTICEVLFACADPGACSNCCCFSRADQFHCEVAIAVVVVRSHRLTFEISEYTVGWLVLSSTKSPTQ